MLMTKMRYSFLLMSILALQGCATTMSTYTPEELPLPSAYLKEGGSEIINQAKWWESFNSKELNVIEEKALSSLFSENKREGNFDLQIAFTRLSQSAATLKQSKSDFYPSLTYRGSSSYANTSNQSTSSSNDETTTYGGSLSLAYELDLWGKIAAQTEADRLSYQATYEDVLTTVLSVSSSIANDYIDLLASRAELAMLDRQIELNTSMVEMQEVRFTYGQASSLDVLQQREQLIQTKSTRPTLVEEERALLASLALLTGELPTYIIPVSETELPELPPLPATGIPSDLLANRPDIRAASYRLLAADKELSIAKLGYFPSITLDITQATSSALLSVLTNSWTTTILGVITGTLFDGGNKAAAAEKQDAVTQEAAINYIQTVAEALDEVNTALMAEQAQKEYIAHLEEQLIYEKEAEKEALTSYLFGEDSFLRYITQLQSLQTLERTILRQKAALLKLRITLYKSLGMTI